MGDIPALSTNPIRLSICAETQLRCLSNRLIVTQLAVLENDRRTASECKATGTSSLAECGGIVVNLAVARWNTGHAMSGKVICVTKAMT